MITTHSLKIKISKYQRKIVIPRIPNIKPKYQVGTTLPGKLKYIQVSNISYQNNILRSNLNIQLKYQISGCQISQNVWAVIGPDNLVSRPVKG